MRHNRESCMFVKRAGNRQGFPARYCMKTDDIPIGCIELRLKGHTDMTERDDGSGRTVLHIIEGKICR